MKIKVGYLLSYDYDMFLTSVMQLYNDVDKIVVGIDKDYLTWSGNKFIISEDFFTEVKNFDTRNIIEFYFDKFYIPNLTPIECESRERNMVLQKLGKGWKIQLDVDEYILNFKFLRTYLAKYNCLTYYPSLTPISLKAKLITLFKKNETGFFYIKDKHHFPLITNLNQNTFTRRSDKAFNHFFNLTVIHQSWARNEKEIREKVENWGHRDDFDTKKYIEFWRSISANNFNLLKNFHPINPPEWEDLYYLETDSIKGFLKKYSELYPENLIDIPLFKLIFFIFTKSLVDTFKQFLKVSINYDSNVKLKKVYRKIRGAE